MNRNTKSGVWKTIRRALCHVPVWMWVSVLCVCAFFVNSSQMPSDIMEARNLVTAREMAHDGHWMIPTMNGELRLEKPPLPTWVAGVVEKVLPDNIAAQRAVPGLMACLWTWCLFLLARYMSQRKEVALAAVLVFITCYQVVFMGRQATWDIWCHALMTAAVYCLLRGLCDKEHPHPWRWLPSAGILMGLSFMSKGPVAFYATLLPWLLAVLMVIKPQWKGKWRPLMVMFLLCVIVSSWWYVYVMLVHPDAMQEVTAKETAAWGERRARPFWYYWRFVFETGIWTPAAVIVLAIPYWHKRINDKKTYLFGMAWLLLTILMLSLVPEKKPRYLLPAMAPFALATGTWLVHLKAKRVLWGIAILFMVVECLLLPTVYKFYDLPYGPSISSVREDSRLATVDFFRPKDEQTRIEIVYKAGRKILPLNLQDSASTCAVLPCAVFTSHSPDSVILPVTLQWTDTVRVGRFDDNTHKKGSRHYHENYIMHVILLTPKQ